MGLHFGTNRSYPEVDFFADVVDVPFFGVYTECMFLPNPTPENVAKMIASLKTSSGREVLETFAEAMAAYAVALHTDDKALLPMGEVAHQAELELRRRLE